MSGFVLGLTKTAVEGTLSRVQTAIEEEAQIKEKVQHDLVFITGELQMMQSFLNIATRERAKNEVVRTWVRQLRELAFDVEDCVEFVVHLDKNKSTWWWRVLPYCVAPPRQLDEVATEIKLLKQRVEDVSQRNTRYNLIISDEPHSTPSSSLRPSSAFHTLRQVWEDAGNIRKIGIQELISREEGSGELQVISLWENGENNLEIPHLIDKAYQDPEICKRFQRRAWVKMTTPFNLDEFINTLLTQLLFPGSSQQGAADAHLTNTAMLLQQVIKEQRYLLVLEQLTDVAAWNAIRKYLSDYNNGSRILMTTQDIGMALRCTGQPYNVSEFRRFPYLCAFYKKVAGSRRDMGELLWRIKRGGVISVYCYKDREKTAILKMLYCSIRAGREEFDGVTFKTHRWVPVLSPFNLADFSRRLLVDVRDEFHDGALEDLANTSGSKFREKWIRKVIRMRDTDAIESCRSLLRDNDYLLIVDGLRTINQWDLIKKTFFSEPTKGCVVAVSKEIFVASHCVNKDQDRLVITLDRENVERERLQKQGRIFSCRQEEARSWISKIFDARARILQPLSGRPVASVWGINGVGKSAHARYNYYRSMLSCSSYKAHCWVDVPHPFCLTELSRRLLLDFHSDDLHAKEGVAVSIMEGQDPVHGCRDLLRPQVDCLLVLDGLRSTDDWDTIKAAFGFSDISSYMIKIIVVTNDQSVARHCVDNNDQHVVNVKGLDADAAFHLFSRKAGYPWVRGRLTDEELQLSKLVVAKCGGLPKVISAVAEDFSISRFISRLDRMKHVTDHFMDTLENDVESFESLRGLFSWMQSYLETCKDLLKPCIFYLPVFPTDHSIRRRRLLRRWIAEGYSRDTSSGTAEENGERLLSELVNLSIIQQPSSKSSCHVNGFFHEYITSRPLEDNLVYALDGHCELNSQRVGQHLSVRRRWDRDISVFESIGFSRLRSFTVFGEWCPFFLSNSTSNKMKLVRVLDLEDTVGVKDDDLEHIGELLPRLKFLSLRGCREITRVPNSLGALRQLQTLDVRQTSITMLPKAVIVMLRKLQYVRAGTNTTLWDGDCITVPCQPAKPPVEEATTAAVAPALVARDATRTEEAPRINKSHTMLPTWLSKMYCSRRRFHNHNINDCVEVPAGIGTLTALHTFGVINLGDGKAIVKELMRLTQLHKLGVSGINADNIHEFFSVISSLSHLESLSVRVRPIKNKEDLIFASLDNTTSPPPKALKILKLHGHVRILSSNWIKQLGNLEKLDLEMILLAQDKMSVLDPLPKKGVLRRLCIRPIQVNELYVGGGEREYSYCTKVLEIDCTSELKVIFGTRTITDMVEVLKVHCSSGSSLQFSEIHNLRALKEVWLKGSYSDALKEDLQRQYWRSTYNPVLKLFRPHVS